MKTIGVRELKQNPSAALRSVEAGETFIVTVQNRPVAQLAPLPNAHQWVSASDVVAKLRDSSVDATWSSELDEMRAAEAPRRDPWDIG